MNNVSFFKNNVDADIYIGKGAGTKLLKDIQNAKKEVKVISPYIKHEYIEELISLKNRGIDVQLISTFDNKLYGRDIYILHRLINQVRDVDLNAQRKRKLIKIQYVIFLILFLLSTVAGLFLIDYGKTDLASYTLPSILFFLILFIVTISRYRNFQLFNYSYHERFPFRLFINPMDKNHNRLSEFFIHSKVYIIDNSIAYLGSANFTNAGMKYNFESRVRITDKEAIQELEAMFKELYSYSGNYMYSTETLGKQIYKEPIN